MLTIRQEQFTFFSRLEVEKFEDWTLAHLKKFFPRECAAAGDERLRDTIQHGIRRAASYGIKTRPDVAKYVDLAVVFGRDFDTDPRLGWAGRILGEKREPSARMRALLRAAKVHLGKR